MRGITGTLREKQNQLLIIAHSTIFRMKNVSVKQSRENQNTYNVQYDFSKIVPFMR